MFEHEIPEAQALSRLANSAAETGRYIARALPEGALLGLLSLEQSRQQALYNNVLDNLDTHEEYELRSGLLVVEHLPPISVSERNQIRRALPTDGTQWDYETGEVGEHFPELAAAWRKWLVEPPIPEPTSEARLLGEACLRIQRISELAMRLDQKRGRLIHRARSQERARRVAPGSDE